MNWLATVGVRVSEDISKGTSGVNDLPLPMPKVLSSKCHWEIGFRIQYSGNMS